MGNPKDKLDEIMDEIDDFKERHDAFLEAERKKAKAEIAAEWTALKELISDSKDFQYCTNKNARMVFIESLLNKEKTKEKCPRLYEYFIPVWKNRSELQAFIDMIWAKNKDKGNKENRS